VIDTDSKLSALLPALASAGWLAVDTEADSLHAYPEKVCLIQISTAAGDELIDPLAALDLAPLFAVFQTHELILHAADYDLRLLRKHHAFVPAAIFDTMLAARLLGERQFGLSALVEKYLGIKLDKGSQKADWAQRPLTERMEIYARNDTRHLKAIADKLRSELELKGRLSWHQESCAQLIAECARPTVVDQDAVWRIKGSHGLDRRSLAVLRSLWHWREKEATAICRPPFFVLNHERMVQMAAAAVADQPLDPLVPPRMNPRRREGLAAAIRAGLAVPAPELPVIIRQRSTRLWGVDFLWFQKWEKPRDRHALELCLDPTLIASRSTLGDLARDWETNAISLMNWQRELLK
jgi:ribonuclease D